ncbi:SUMF1/EgtB/PvdO family nonheme iron enzyme [Myxococcota bacterium]|nr:SUMF1/EgtB/PvdO family nonheme iron enzyme [Myxococcota bacterium]
MFLTNRTLVAAVTLSALTTLAPGLSDAATPARWPTLAEPPAGAAGGGKADAAVIVGVEDYAFLPDVPGAVANANAWETWLERTRKVPGERIRVLRNEQGTNSKIKAALEGAAKDVQRGGTLWVVFIGHGAPMAQTNDGVLVGVDAQQDPLGFYSRGLRRGEVLEVAGRAAARGANPVVVLDACFSGRSAGGASLLPGSQVALPASFATAGSVTVLSAGAAHEIAGPLPGPVDVQRPAFSYLMLGALLGWADGALDERADGEVTVPEALTYVRRALRKLDATREQTPECAPAERCGASLGKSAGERGPDLGALAGVVNPPVRPVDPGPSGGGFDAAIRAALEKQAAADAARAEAERVAAEAARLEREARAAHLARVDADFTKVKTAAKAGPLAAKAAVEAFIGAYAKHPLGNPREAEARALLSEDDTGGGGDAPAGYVTIPAGEFMMGSPESEEGYCWGEKRHRVRITRGFYLKATEVTQGEWESVMGSNPSRFKNCGKTCPVESVSWIDAVSYLNKLSDHEDLPRCYHANGAFVGLSCKGYRLPTEAEWEYAARAGTTGAVYAGTWDIVGENNAPALGPIAWYGGNSGVSYEGGSWCGDRPEKQEASSTCGTHPVGQKRANAWGLFDMLGNVEEWTNDWSDQYPGGKETDPVGPASGGFRSTRGGGWSNIARHVRAAVRGWYAPGNRFDYLGFRPLRAR